MLNNLLDKVMKLRKTGQDRWSACCPAHQDKSPSLAIRALPDGRILLHCFGGCSTESILDSLGMTFQDLMPDPVAPHMPSVKQPFPASQGLKQLAFESGVVADCARQVHAGKRLSKIDADRLKAAQQKISEVMTMCY